MHTRWLGLLLAVALGACSKFDDCKLYNTCSGDLIELAVETAGDAGPECDTCLRRECTDQARDCSADPACHYPARCRLATDPVEWQECLLRLYRRGYSRGDEARFVWEGKVGKEEEDFSDKNFSSCLASKCKGSCVDPGRRWTCEYSVPYYDGSFTAKLSIRRVPIAKDQDRRPDAPLPSMKIRARFCTGENAEQCANHPWYPGNRYDEIDVPTGSSRSDSLHFELQSCRTQPLGSAVDCEAPALGDEQAIPPTLYYPGPLVPGVTQPVPIYVVTSKTVAASNQVLSRGPSVLSDVSQSLILPDSCIWESDSAPGVRIRVEERPDLTLCQTLPEGRQCEGDACKPCIWYAVAEIAKATTTQTDGTGAGVLGLPTGPYTIIVEDVKTGAMVGKRTIQLRAGYLTIARIWPLSRE